MHTLRELILLIIVTDDLVNCLNNNRIVWVQNDVFVLYWKMNIAFLCVLNTMGIGRNRIVSPLRNRIDQVDIRLTQIVLKTHAPAWNPNSTPSFWAGISGVRVRSLVCVVLKFPLSMCSHNLLIGIVVRTWIDIRFASLLLYTVVKFLLFLLIAPRNLVWFASQITQATVDVLFFLSDGAIELIKHAVGFPHVCGEVKLGRVRKLRVVVGDVHVVEVSDRKE